MVPNTDFERNRICDAPATNIIKLRQQLMGLGAPIAIALGGNLLIQPPLYTNTEVIIRGNTIRLVDGITDPTFAGSGISILGAKKALVYDNIIDLPPPDQLIDWGCGDVPYLNNRTAAGALVQGQTVNGNAFVPQTDLELEIDDAALLSI